jgi:hypothetical protein
VCATGHCICGGAQGNLYIDGDHLFNGRLGFEMGH